MPHHIATRSKSDSKQTLSFHKENALTKQHNSSNLTKTTIKKIKVNIRDKQNVIESLKAEGYPEAKINSFLKTTELKFVAYANLMYLEILKKVPPQLITVNLVQKESDVNMTKTASFLTRKSNDEHILFEIHMQLVKRVLDNPTDNTYATILIHEMMHAADFSTLDRIDKVLERLKSKWKVTGSASNASLFLTLQMLERLRADSIAQLGRFLLAQMKMGVPVHDYFEPFRQNLDSAMTKATFLITQPECCPTDNISIDDSRHLSEFVGPCLLLMALAKMGLVKGELVEEALNGFMTGHSLDKQITMAILHSALSLSFADYLKGLLLLGEEYIPVKTILEYFSLLQQNGKKEKMEAILELLEQPHSVSSFHQAIERIIGKEALTKDLKEPYQDFCIDPPHPIDYPSLKSNINTLYRVMLNDGSMQKRQIARSALAYYFADESAINNRIIGFGRVDDLIVIDYAKDLLRAS